MLKNKIVISAIVFSLSTVMMVGCGSTGDKVSKLDLNSMSLESIVQEAKKEGRIDSVGMPDTWANWGETWTDIKTEYGLDHTDVDMSSAEELAVFEAEKTNATKDLGDVGQSYGPLAETKGLTIPYKTSYWNDIPDWAKDDNGDWIVSYYGTISIFTNTKLVQNPPKSFDDILNGDYMVSIGDVTKATQAQNAVLAAAIAYGGSEKDIQPGIDYFRKLAEQGRLDKGDLSMARIEKGEVAVCFLWDFNALGYGEQFKVNNNNASFATYIPSDGSIQSGYCTVINAYTKRPHAAALTREYILSDKGQINLARGFARPIRDNVQLPDDVKALLLPDSEYVNAKPIDDKAAWDETVKTLGTKWQEEVMAYAK